MDELNMAEPLPENPIYQNLTNANTYTDPAQRRFFDCKTGLALHTLDSNLSMGGMRVSHLQNNGAAAHCQTENTKP